MDAYDQRERIARELDTVGHAIVPNHLPSWLCERPPVCALRRGVGFSTVRGCTHPMDARWYQPF